MKQRPKQPPVPSERHETIRKEIIHLLGDYTLTAREISGEVGISERDVNGHLEHIHRSLHASGDELVSHPAECAECGFVFKKREKYTKPGRCPVCRGEQIRPPAFSVRHRG